MSENGLAKALLAFQAEVPNLGLQKSAENPHFRNKFVPLDELLLKVLPLLNKHGLFLTQAPAYITVNGQITSALQTTLWHAETGETLESEMPLLLAKDDPQGQGSAITYARRYSLMAILGLVADEDDDGQTATTRRAERGAAEAPDPLAAERAHLLGVVGELETVSPVDPGLGTWSENVASYCKEQGWKGGLKALNAEQLQQVTEKFEGYLRAEKEAAGTPF